jgi:hypothetical protein
MKLGISSHLISSHRGIDKRNHHIIDKGSCQRRLRRIDLGAGASASVSDRLLVFHRASISQGRLRTAGSGFHYC